MEISFLALFVTAFLTGLSGAAAPGPLLTWNIAAASRLGASVGPRMVVGHAAVELPLVVMLALGLGPVIQNVRVLGILSLVGAMVLAWMAYSTFRALPTLPDPFSSRKIEGQAGLGRPFVVGAVLSIGNPYWIVWWATVGAGLIGRSLEYGVAGLFVFFVGHILADFSWYGAVSAAVSRGLRFLGRRGYVALMAFLGVALVLLSAAFLSGALEMIASAR